MEKRNIEKIIRKVIEEESLEESAAMTGMPNYLINYFKCFQIDVINREAKLKALADYGQNHLNNLFCNTSGKQFDDIFKQMLSDFRETIQKTETILLKKMVKKLALHASVESKGKQISSDDDDFSLDDFDIEPTTTNFELPEKLNKNGKSYGKEMMTLLKKLQSDMKMNDDYRKTSTSNPHDIENLQKRVKRFFKVYFAKDKIGEVVFEARYQIARDNLLKSAKLPATLVSKRQQVVQVDDKATDFNGHVGRLEEEVRSLKQELKAIKDAQGGG